MVFAERVLVRRDKPLIHLDETATQRNRQLRESALLLDVLLATPFMLVELVALKTSSISERISDFSAGRITN